MFTTTEINIFLSINDGLARRFAYSDCRVLNNAVHFVHSAQGIGLGSYINNYTFSRPTECDKTKFKIFMTYKLNRTRTQVRKYTHSHGAFIPLQVKQQRCNQREFHLRSTVALLLRYSFFCAKLVRVGSKRVSICAP
jgi:hypothetical protein